MACLNTWMARSGVICGAAFKRLGVRLLLAVVLSGQFVMAQTVTTTLTAGTAPNAVAVNPVTNKIYVANGSSNNVTVIDGATNALTTLAAGTGPRAVAINPVTNKIYVVNQSSNNVTVIDGATNALTTLAAGTQPNAVAVNPVTNKIYVSNSGGANVTVIDGATNALTALAAGTVPFAVAINPVANKIYVANQSSNNVTVIDAAPTTSTNHQTSVAMAGGTVTSLTAPSLSLTVNGAYAPNDPLVRTVYYRLGDAQGSYTAATGSGPFTAALSGLRLGENIVSLFAVDAMDGTSIGNGSTSSMIGAPTIFAFTVVSPPVITTASPLATGTVGTAYSQSITASGGVGALTFAVTSGTLPAGLTLSSAGLLSGTPSAGMTSFTVTATDAMGGTGAKAFSLTINQATSSVAVSSSASPVTAFSAVTFTAIVTGAAPTGTINFKRDGTTIAGCGAKPLASNFAQCTTTIATLGTRTITADYSGDTNNAVSTGTLGGGQIVIPPTITVSPLTLTSGNVGAAYSQTFAASGGTVAYTFALSAGALPGGLTLASGGQLSGSPNAAGTFNFTVNATDANGFTGATAYTVTINQGQTVTFSPASPVSLGAAPVTLTASASSGLTAFTFSTGSAAGICTVSGNQLTIVGAGTCALTATQPGDLTYPSASANASVIINPMFTAVQSRKVHGAAGPFDLPIDTTLIAPLVTVDPRVIGGGHLIVFQFNGAVANAGSASITNGAVTAPIAAGNEVLVTLTGVPDNQRATVTLTNVNGSVNPPPVSIGFMVGDINNSRSVNSSDISGVKARSGQTTNASNFKFDVNATGAINSSDISVVKARSGLVLP